MSQDTKAQASELGVTLEELIRRGARELIQRAVEVEIGQMLSEYENVRTWCGARAVVRNGYLPAREILAVEVRVPKVRDRSGAGVRFNSALVQQRVWGAPNRL